MGQGGVLSALKGCVQLPATVPGGYVTEAGCKQNCRNGGSCAGGGGGAADRPRPNHGPEEVSRPAMPRGGGGELFGFRPSGGIAPVCACDGSYSWMKNGDHPCGCAGEEGSAKSTSASSRGSASCSAKGASMGAQVARRQSDGGAGARVAANGSRHPLGRTTAEVGHSELGSELFGPALGGAHTSILASAAPRGPCATKKCPCCLSTLCISVTPNIDPLLSATMTPILAADFPGQGPEFEYCGLSQTEVANFTPIHWQRWSTKEWNLAYASENLDAGNVIYEGRLKAWSAIRRNHGPCGASGRIMEGYRDKLHFRSWTPSDRNAKLHSRTFFVASSSDIEACRGAGAGPYYESCCGMVEFKLHADGTKWGRIFGPVCGSHRFCSGLLELGAWSDRIGPMLQQASGRMQDIAWTGPSSAITYNSCGTGAR